MTVRHNTNRAGVSQRRIAVTGLSRDSKQPAN